MTTRTKNRQQGTGSKSKRVSSRSRSTTTRTLNSESKVDLHFLKTGLGFSVCMNFLCARALVIRDMPASFMIVNSECYVVAFKCRDGAQYFEYWNYLTQYIRNCEKKYGPIRKEFARGKAATAHYDPQRGTLRYGPNKKTRGKR